MRARASRAGEGPFAGFEYDRAISSCLSALSTPAQSLLGALSTEDGVSISCEKNEMSTRRDSLWTVAHLS